MIFFPASLPRAICGKSKITDKVADHDGEFVMTDAKGLSVSAAANLQL